MIEPGDLKDDGKMLEHYRGARKRGMVGRSQADLLNYFGACEHAMAVNPAKPEPLFAWMVSRRRWHLISDAEEARAVRRLKRIRDGEREEVRAEAALVDERIAAARARIEEMGGGK